MAYTRIIENLVLTSTLRLDGPEWSNTLVRNVTIKGTSSDGIFLKDVENVRIENCTIQNVGGDGIKLSSAGSTKNVVIDGNTIENTGRNGITAGQREADGVDHPGLQILNNTVDTTGTSGTSGLLHGIYIQSGDFVIKGNQVTNSTDGNGISVRSSGLVANNVVDGAGKSGIGYYSDHDAGASDLLTIENNLVMNAGKENSSRNEIDLLDIPNTSFVVHNFVIRNNNMTNTDGSALKVHSDYASLGIKPQLSNNNVVSSSTAQSLIDSTLNGGTTTTPTEPTSPPPTEPTTPPTTDGLTGTTGDDKLTGTAANESLDGGAGRDILDGRGGNDVLKGGADGDTFVIAKGMGSDTIVDFYAQYADVVRVVDYGVTSFDQLKPLMRLSGSDTVITFANGETLTLKGVDPSALAASEFEFVNSAPTTPTTPPTTPTTPTPPTDQTVTGTTGNDRLTGGTGADSIDGGAGRDILDGSAGNDVLKGGADGDTFVIAKGNGSDTIVDFYAQFSDVIRLGGYDISSFDQLKTLATQVGADTVIKLSTTETLTLKGVQIAELTANDFTFQTKFTLPTSGAATSTFTGTSSNNTLKGTAGNDQINGGGGSDTMYGYKGDDTYLVENANDKVVEAAGEGVDTVKAAVSYTLASNVENLVLTGSSALNGTGNALNNQLVGNAGANKLSGGDGKDVLVGGGGADVLTGGNGADIFKYGAVTDKGDTITDFQVGVDMIDVHDAMVAAGYTGNNAIADHRLVLTQSGTSTQVTVVDNAGTSHVMMTLLGVNTDQLVLNGDIWA